MINSIPTCWKDGWSASMPSRMVAWNWIRTSSCIPVRCVCTRCAWRAAMLRPILTDTPLEVWGPWLTMLAFGAYHGLNPGMAWLFALSLGLQRESERAIWLSLLPIAGGHALSLLAAALLVIAGSHFISVRMLEILMALALIGFGCYKIFNY